MSTYASCNQSAKDLINDILARYVTTHKTTDLDVVVTLDDVDNGTSQTLISHALYYGNIAVVQRDKDVLVAQHQNWLRTNPGSHNRFRIFNNDISKDFQRLHSVWTSPFDVRLWNCDYVSTFYTAPVQTLRHLLEMPNSVLSTQGTYVALTFQAVPHRGLIAKLGHIWPERCDEWVKMRSWSDLEIAETYLSRIEEQIAALRPNCTDFEPCKVDKWYASSNHATVLKNTVVYRGNANDSIMMFALFRGNHHLHCKQDHSGPDTEKDFIEIPVEIEMSDEQEQVRLQTIKRKRVEDSEESVPIRRSPSTPSEHGKSSQCQSDSSESDESDAISDFGFVEVESDSEGSDAGAWSHDTESTDMELDMTVNPDDNDMSTFDIDLSTLTLFEHQKAIVEAVRQAPDRGYINAICGSGKSLPMVICCKAVNTSVIFVPFKILVDQFYHQYFEHDHSVTVHRVNSDHVQDIPIPVAGARTVYLANFDSAHRLAALGIHFDLVNWDEAHLATSDKRRARIAGDRDDHDAECIDAGQVPLVANKQIFWTATPNTAMSRYPDIYGHELFRYSFSDAVADKIIKSFGIIISCYKDDYGDADNNPARQYEKIVHLSSRFIEEENCKRILIYVNRVTQEIKDKEEKELISVENMERTRTLFPSKFKLSFLSAKTSKKERQRIFDQFRNASTFETHVLVSCRTVSVGVDLPNCDAVIFAAPSMNVTEIVQRGCRPCRLTNEERRSGEFHPAKLFFPINTSAMDVHNYADQSKKNETIQQAIRGNPLEVPMTVLNLLKTGLAIDLVFATSLSQKTNRRKLDLENLLATEDKGCDVTRSISIPVRFHFPYMEHSWKESETEWVAGMNHMCVALQKAPTAIPGWDSMTDWERADCVARWSDEHGGARPKAHGGKERDPVQKLISTWVHEKLRKGHTHCYSSQALESLRRHAWFNKSLDNMLREQDPCPISGWDRMTERERADHIAGWSEMHGNARPKNKGGKYRNPEQRLMATWLQVRLRKGHAHCSGVNFEKLMRHDWFNDLLDNLLKEKKKDPCPIPGWENMTDKERADHIARWCDDHGGVRPKQLGGKERDPDQKLMDAWLRRKINRGHAHCSGHNYESLKRHSWFSKLLEVMQKGKDPCPIPGWETMSVRKRVDHIAGWSDNHGGARPKAHGGKERDPEQQLMASWLNGRRKKGHAQYFKIDYQNLRRHLWFNEFLENLLKGRDPCPIPEWNGMTNRERAEHVARWSDEHDGTRPTRLGKKGGDPEQKLYAGWLDRIRKKGHAHCSGQDFENLKRHLWFRDMLERLRLLSLHG